MYTHTHTFEQKKSSPFLGLMFLVKTGIDLKLKCNWNSIEWSVEYGFAKWLFSKMHISIWGKNLLFFDVLERDLGWKGFPLFDSLSDVLLRAISTLSDGDGVL